MNALKALADVPVDRDTHHRIEQFLFREARLLDEERWDDWLTLMAEDIHYWMPTMENRRRADKAGPYGPDRGALYDDNLHDLTRRVTRFKQPSAWAEDPPTRHAHMVSGVEAYEGERSGEYRVHSTFVNYRTRVDHDNYLLCGRREDVLRVEADGLRLARRKIVITQSVLMAKNLNTFL